ncbi:MAG: glycosyltransferase family 2 protein [Candidatus Omnitrophota bacterium]|nr:MAG: glycosyltransferase family 2 protein [Candidatus Omnitrophota bacterium]
MTPTSVSFVIPMYNESRAIANTVKKLTQIAKGLTGDYEIIIADDGSTDDSGRIIDRIAEEDSRVKIEHLKKNTKFGGALKRGLNRAQKDIIIYTDSDLPIDSGDIKEALSILDGCDIVTASSRVKKGENLKRIIMSKVYNFLIQFLFKTHIKDINSGFKIYKRKIFENMKLSSNSPFIDVEIFVKALKRNFIIKECPVIFKHRQEGKSYISRPAVVFATAMDMLRFKFNK